MKNFIFKRESNNFSDILTDKSIKKFIITKLRCKNYLVLCMGYNFPDTLYAYVNLKYGTDMSTLTDKDYRPIIGKDYSITRKKHESK